MKKKVIRLTESDLNSIIEGSVRKILNEYEDSSYYGSVMSDNQLDDDESVDGLTIDELGRLDRCIGEISEIVDRCGDDCIEIADAIDVLELFVERKKKELIRL